MWATFATKVQKQLYMKFVCKFFFDFPIPTSSLVQDGKPSELRNFAKGWISHPMVRMENPSIENIYFSGRFIHPMYTSNEHFAHALLVSAYCFHQYTYYTI